MPRHIQLIFSDLILIFSLEEMQVPDVMYEQNAEIDDSPQSNVHRAIVEYRCSDVTAKIVSVEVIDNRLKLRNLIYSPSRNAHLSLDIGLNMSVWNFVWRKDCNCV